MRYTFVNVQLSTTLDDLPVYNSC